jgi:hypothetical protein
VPLPQDKLTNLTHESELESQIVYELSRGRRYGWPLSFLLVEPVLPDGVGQDMTYPALRRLALTCSQQMRSVDRGIRCGSGVLYVLPETPKEGADVALAKVRTNFAETEVPNPISGETFRCTLRGAVYTFDGARAVKEQSVPPNWREVLVQLRGDME